MYQINLNHAEFAELSAEILGRGHTLRFKAGGSSMRPFIRHGDILTIEPVEAATLNVGDVAFYRSAGNGLVAHRVVGKRLQDDRAALLTRGDASLGPDERVRAEQVLGRVVSLQREQKTIRLDQAAWRWGSFVWIRLVPLRPLLFWLVRAIKILSPKKNLLN